MSSTANQIISELISMANTQKASLLSRFFKTGKGQYGEGDKFLGITVPQSRIIVRKYWQNTTLNDVKVLLDSPIHEVRLVALLILVKMSDKGDRKKIFDFYLSNVHRVNNWDLVDVSAPRIVGRFLQDWDFDEYYSIISNLAKSSNLWEKRIAIVSTLYFIINNDFKPTIKISEQLLTDPHDLIHKACGWMLREVGKKDEKVLLSFLDKYYKVMPRTMLRYSIERFSQSKKKHYMKK